MSMIVAVDGDIVCYRCAASCLPSKAKPFEEPLSEAILRLDTLMHRILDDCDTGVYLNYLTGSQNFRKRLDPSYKANRVKEAPPHLAACQEYLMEHWDAKMCDGYEADDALGIAATEHRAIIASIDKDLLQVPGLHYNFVRNEFIEQDVNAADLAFWTLMLVGDRSDNILGVKGIGEVGARKHLAHLRAGDREDVVRELYADHDRFELNYKLIRVIRTKEELMEKTRNHEEEANIGTVRESEGPFVNVQAE